MKLDFAGKAVLVTGGTKGIGLATALEFGRYGAHCILTYRFGSADAGEILKSFAEAGAPEPLLVQSDVGNAEDTDALLAEIKKRHDHVECFVSNVSNAVVITDVKDYKFRGLAKTLELSAWPMWDHTRKIKEVFGTYPRYVIAMSSTGPDHYSVGYDFLAASKAAMEVLCRYLNYRLYDEDIRINVLRSRSVKTDSMRDVFGSEFEDWAKRFTQENHFLPAREVAETAVMLASGYLDGIRGQVLTVDRGTTFFDDFTRLWSERQKLGLAYLEKDRE